MFQACLMVIPSQVVCFENHAEWRFCLAPFWCVAPGRRSGARLAQWRPSALLLPSFVLALCRARAHLLWMFILTHATALKPFHSKQSYPLHHLQHRRNTITNWTTCGFNKIFCDQFLRGKRLSLTWRIFLQKCTECQTFMVSFSYTVVRSHHGESLRLLKPPCLIHLGRETSRSWRGPRCL